MSDVAVIGLGRMGSALAKALVSSGKRVTVWNRSQGKTDALVRIGALEAETPAAAIASSSTLIVCLSDYAATSIVLDGSSPVEEPILTVQFRPGPIRSADLKLR